MKYQAVMVSSTYRDLEIHRREVIRAIESFELFPRVMEFDGARADVDVIESSLRLVHDAGAYIGLIGHKYGQVPVCPIRNPDGLSLTELEFNEAARLGRPIILFLMSDEHPVKVADVERDSAKVAKLDAFKTSAKRMRPGSKVERVYETFTSLDDFAKRAAVAVGRLANHLRRESVLTTPASDTEATRAETQAPHVPPELRAVPRYLGSHSFVGRKSELKNLDEWAIGADPNPVLLFEAIGGSGKSMLTWEWTTKYATGIRSDWAGRFWYSFYERGAMMVDFCREALSYMTSVPAQNFSKMSTEALSEQLILELERRPWLVVLDGLERVLVFYQRIDAAQIRDEETDLASDPIASRDPCAAIRPADDALLRQLASAAPSKILITSRLIPRVLINQSGTSVPGVRREILRGLRPADAEALLIECGVSGDSGSIRDFLQANCDCHPLVVGALAGLVNGYLPDRGNFDAWVVDPKYGRALNLANLDLIQRRNHILDAAISALTPTAQRLLKTLSLLQRGADFETLSALNPHLLPKPEEVTKPSNPTEGPSWERWNEVRRGEEVLRYEARDNTYKSYLNELAVWRDGPEARNAPALLHGTVRELERRGLLQYDSVERRYDLHPVVRGIAIGNMGVEEKNEQSKHVVNYFETRQPADFQQVNQMEDLLPAFQIVATLAQIGDYEKAQDVFDQFESALNLIAPEGFEQRTLLKPFFPFGWDAAPVKLRERSTRDLMTSAGRAHWLLDPAQSLRLYERAVAVKEQRPEIIIFKLIDIASSLARVNKLADSLRLRKLAFELALTSQEKDTVAETSLSMFYLMALIGNNALADEFWETYNNAFAEDSVRVLPPSKIRLHLDYLLDNDKLTDGYLLEVESFARLSGDRLTLMWVLQSRGEYHMNKLETEKAVNALTEAVRLARELGIAGEAKDIVEALFILSRVLNVEQFDTRTEVQRLNCGHPAAALYVAEIWKRLGESKNAMAAALRAHSWAVGEGEPYVRRHALGRTRAVLLELGGAFPVNPTYNPQSAREYEWEKDVKVMIDGLKARRSEKPEAE